MLIVQRDLDTGKLDEAAVEQFCFQAASERRQ